MATLCTWETYVGEVRTYSMDFAQQEEIATNDETLSSPVITYSPSSGGLTIGSPAISGTKVLVQITANTANTYTVHFAVSTSGGSTLIEEQPLEVNP